MTTWLFDLGNTRLKFATLALDHRAPDWVEQLAQGLPPRFALAQLTSVGPAALRLRLLDALAQRCARICIATTQPAFAGVRIAYAQPRHLGVDRFLALLAAHRRAGGVYGTLVCGIGTALTLDLIDTTGRHHGGRIAPSPTLMRQALHERAAQLPATGGQYLAFAGDTADALASGCDGAALGLIQHSLAAAGGLLGRAPQLVLHGGGSAALLPHLPGAIHAPSLVLEGLACWVHATAPA